jgi:hypothetical protein
MVTTLQRATGSVVPLDKFTQAFCGVGDVIPAIEHVGRRDLDGRAAPVTERVSNKGC